MSPWRRTGRWVRSPAFSIAPTAWARMPGSPAAPLLTPRAEGSWVPGFDWKHWGDESEFLLISLKTSLLFMTGKDSHQKCVAGYNLKVSSNSGNFQEGLIVNTIMCPQVTNQWSYLFNSFAQKNNEYKTDGGFCLFPKTMLSVHALGAFLLQL